MVTENRTVDGRLYARPVRQHHAALPLIRRETSFERRRRQRARLIHLSFILLAAAAVLAVSPF